MPGGEVEDLGPGHVPCRREAGPGEGLEEHAVECEQEQGGIAQLPGQRLGLARRLPGALPVDRGQIGAAALDRDGGQQAGAQVGGAVGAERGECALGRRDDGAGLLEVVGPAPEGGHVVGVDDAGGQEVVAGAFGRS